MDHQFSRFEPFSREHLGAVACVVIASIVLSVVAGKRLPIDSRKRIAVALAAVLALDEVAYLIYKIARSGDQIWGAMPFHLCELSAFAVIVALGTRRQFAYEFAYFFGVGGALQALVTPDLRSVFPSFPFVKFFVSHGGVIAGVLYLTIAFGLRPTKGCIWRMIMAGNFYLAAVGAFNWVAGTNYGYVCRKPELPSLLDHLGPWPWYLIWMEVIGVLTIALLYAPFALTRKLSESDLKRTY